MAISFSLPSLSGDLRKTTFVGLTAVLAFGTAYSILFNTYLDTSDPLVALGSVRHPLHDSSPFARKSNIINTLFIKKAWAWTSAAFLLLLLTFPSAPPMFSSRDGEKRPRPVWMSTCERLGKWGIATLVWASFAAWFFGPAVLERINVLSGAECVVRFPSGDIHAVPIEYCYSRTTLSPATHPQAFRFPELSLIETWRVTPRLMRGHDVSGHIFLLTMSLLFLADMLRPSIDLLRIDRTNGTKMENIPATHLAALGLVSTLMCVWYFSILVTGVYWHTPLEKATGWALGVIGFLATQLPDLRERPEVPHIHKQ